MLCCCWLDWLCPASKFFNEISSSIISSTFSKIGSTFKTNSSPNCFLNCMSMFYNIHRCCCRTNETLELHASANLPQDCRKMNFYSFSKEFVLLDHWTVVRRWELKKGKKCVNIIVIIIIALQLISQFYQQQSTLLLCKNYFHFDFLHTHERLWMKFTIDQVQVQVIISDDIVDNVPFDLCEIDSRVNHDLSHKFIRIVFTFVFYELAIHSLQNNNNYTNDICTKQFSTHISLLWSRWIWRKHK